jgi:magnesium chelatase subunit I
MTHYPATLGELRSSPWAEHPLVDRSVRDEIRSNLIAALDRGDELFPGIHGYEDTIVPRIVNALLARHDFILLGLRGQAKTRILRALTAARRADSDHRGQRSQRRSVPPLSKYARERIAELRRPDADRLARAGSAFVEKLATPDVTIADIIGDVDPIKAARGGHLLSDELTMHFGLLPRANRGIFAINELPDLSGKIQVGLFNIMQEGDVQMKGYPGAAPARLCCCFTANPEDYTARGKIITPLKDRIGSEILTHYPRSVELGMAITLQEAWVDAGRRSRCRSSWSR